MGESGCIFCAIGAGTMSADMVHQDDRVIAFRDVAPRAPVHVLIIPKRHLASVDAAGAEDEELLGHLFSVARDVARAEGLVPDGYRLVVNSGPAAGQTVDHLHVHLLGGRELGWPPG
ncbi:MAG: histidine triad nucleotide-binding protein [Gemmatimonadota bacterium]